MGKILFVATHFPPAIGGTPTLYFNICKNIDPKKIIVLTCKFKGWEAFDQNQRFKIYRLNNFLVVDLSIFKEVKYISQLIKKEGIDKIIFGHINFCLTALILRFLFNKDYYLYIHGDEITRNFGGKYYQFFKWKSLKYAKGIVVISDYAKNLVKKYNSNIKIIYNAVDAKEFMPKPKEKTLVYKHNLENEKILLTISRLENRKGHDMVIKCIKEIIKEEPNIKYLIGGTGEEEPALKSLVLKLKLEEHVEFLGEISPELLVDYYNLCDIFVMPNRELEDGNTEGFGIVFLEANACGKPVIGGKTGGVSSAIKDGYNGFLVDGNSVQEISNAILRLLKNDSLRNRIGENGLSWVKNFTYEKLVGELLVFLNVN